MGSSGEQNCRMRFFLGRTGTSLIISERPNKLNFHLVVLPVAKILRSRLEQD